jgi:hypothetical protein
LASLTPVEAGRTCEKVKCSRSLCHREDIAVPATDVPDSASSIEEYRPHPPVRMPSLKETPSKMFTAPATASPNAATDQLAGKSAAGIQVSIRRE